VCPVKQLKDASEDMVVNASVRRLSSSLPQKRRRVGGRTLGNLIYSSRRKHRGKVGNA